MFSLLEKSKFTIEIPNILHALPILLQNVPKLHLDINYHHFDHPFREFDWDKARRALMYSSLSLILLFLLLIFFISPHTQTHTHTLSYEAWIYRGIPENSISDSPKLELKITKGKNMQNENIFLNRCLNSIIFFLLLRGGRGGGGFQV